MSRHAGNGAQYGKHDADGDIEAWGGIVSAHLADLAEKLSCSPEALMRAADREGITPMVDTAKRKGRRSEPDRPTDPAVRCVAFRAEDVRRLEEVLEDSPAEPETAPAEAG